MTRICSIDGCKGNHLAKGLCSKHYHKQWQIDNPDKVKEKRRKHYLKHQSRYRKSAEKWRKDNPEKQRERSKANYHKNKERYSQNHKKYYAKHGDRLRAYARGFYTKKKKTPFQRWKAENKELSHRITKKAAKANRTAKKYALPDRITSEQLWNRIALWGDRCWICSSSYNCIDHVIPMGKDGANLPCNIRPCCNFCNRRKHVKILH